MRVLADRGRAAMLVAAMTAAGFALTLYIFYPGIRTFDARYVYQDIAKGFVGDWQSPVMTRPVVADRSHRAWNGKLVPADSGALLARIRFTGANAGAAIPGLALLVLFLALSPPAFVFVGIIWRDVLFAVIWLLAAALVFAFADRSRKALAPVQAVGLALIAFGVMLRPNALAAAPVLAGYILWPRYFSWSRVAICYLPLALGLYGLVHLVYYGVIGATRQYPLHSIMVFDLGGISHFAKGNMFPGSWMAEETALITDRCYQPTEWNIYWTVDPCKFVMLRLEDGKIFGSPVITNAWKEAIISHPSAYFQHRAAFMWTLLTGANLTMWTIDVDDTSKSAFANNPPLMAISSLHDALKPTPLFRAGTWLLLNTVLCLLAWRRRHTPAGAFVLGICGSATCYMMTFFVVGVAPDFRYAYWAVLAGLTGGVAVWLRPSQTQ